MGVDIRGGNGGVSMGDPSLEGQNEIFEIIKKANPQKKSIRIALKFDKEDGA